MQISIRGITAARFLRARLLRRHSLYLGPCLWNNHRISGWTVHTCEPLIWMYSTSRILLLFRGKTRFFDTEYKEHEWCICNAHGLTAFPLRNANSFAAIHPFSRLVVPNGSSTTPPLWNMIQSPKLMVILRNVAILIISLHCRIISKRRRLAAAWSSSTILYGSGSVMNTICLANFWHFTAHSDIVDFITYRIHVRKGALVFQGPFAIRPTKATFLGGKYCRFDA